MNMTVYVLSDGEKEGQRERFFILKMHFIYDLINKFSSWKANRKWCNINMRRSFYQMERFVDEKGSQMCWHKLQNCHIK